MKCVQFSNEAQTEIIASFSCPQDETAYPNQGVVEDDDPRYSAFIAQFETGN